MNTWSQRIGDVVGLGLITVAMNEVCSQMFGAHDRMPAIIVAVACASYPAQQLLTIRRFRAGATRVLRGPALLSITPVMLLPLLLYSYPSLATWQPVVPPPTVVRTVGLLLALGVVLAHPLFPRGLSSEESPLGPPPITLPSLLLVLSVLLVSFSAAAAALTTYWFAAHGVARVAHAYVHA